MHRQGALGVHRFPRNIAWRSARGALELNQQFPCRCHLAAPRKGQLHNSSCDLAVAQKCQLSLLTRKSRHYICFYGSITAIFKPRDVPNPCCRAKDGDWCILAHELDPVFISLFWPFFALNAFQFAWDESGFDRRTANYLHSNFIRDITTC
jgi:hypothetical protein